MDRRVHVFVCGLLLLMLMGCGTPAGPTVTPAPTRTATPTPTPAPTWTPTPTPTATPIPPAHLEVLWPAMVSPLTPMPIEAALVPPPGLDVRAELSATIMDPEAGVYATYDLAKQEGHRYRAQKMLQLPLEPMPGYWWLIVHVESELPTVGDPARFFEVEPVAFRALTSTLPAAVSLKIPTAFQEVVAQGDTAAGGRVWRHGEGEVSLWWAPGPTEALLVSNALVALEASYAADARYEAFPAPPEAVPVVWDGRPGFEFAESWSDPDPGPGRAWVLQGADHWLYILRIRALGRDDIPPLHEEVAQTFTFVEQID
ncbi:MAG: hypothetical protein ACP5HS_03585 [Anaerolineae bacterium]